MDIEAALTAYRKGDRLGAPWEGGPAHWSPVSYEKILARKNQYPLGTDEADTVDCFEKFLTLHGYDENLDNLLVAWARFHERNRRTTCYGETWKDYFATVRGLDKSRMLTTGRLFTLSAERKPGGSLGNGCLALGLPAYAYAKKLGLQSKEVMQSFFRLSHSHEGALGCARFLCDLFDAVEAGRKITALDADCQPVKTFLTDKEWQLKPEVFARKYPHNVLCCYTVIHALYGVLNASSEEELIVWVVSMNGDVDSVLSLAMLLFSLFEGGGGSFR